MSIIDRFTQGVDALTIQLGRPVGPWLDTYCMPHGGPRPDILLVTEVRAFIDAVRSRARVLFPNGATADAAAQLIGHAGMIARNVTELDLSLAQAADWHGFYAPRAMRDGIVRDRIALRHALAERAGTIKGRLHTLVDRRAYEMNPLSLDGTRTFPFGGTIGVLRIGDAGQMEFGVASANRIYIVSQIDDRDGPGRRETAPEPSPEPELAN